MSENLPEPRSIPVSEYRRAGYALLFENTGVWGLLAAALLASLLVVLGLALLITVVFVLSELFGVGMRTFTRDFASVFMPPPARPVGFFAYLLLPFRLLGELWRADLFVSVLFMAAALPARRAFFLNREKERGRDEAAGGFFSRQLPLLIFMAGFLVLFLLVMLPYLQGSLDIHGSLIPLPAGSLLLTLAAVLGYAIIAGFLLQFIWEGAFFRGLLVFHRLAVDPPRQVTDGRIRSLFEENNIL